MNKKFSFIYKLAANALAVVICLPLFSCGRDNVPEIVQEETSTPVVGEGLVDTGKLIVKENGASDYKILIPELYDRDIEFAASELQYAIQLTTGYTMEITDVYQSDAKYLSIGDTPLYLNNKQRVDGNGFDQLESRVITLGDSVIMKGYDNEYSLYSAYEFMELAMGFKWYTYDTPRVICSDVVKLYDFDYSHTASVPVRSVFSEKYSTSTSDRIRNNRRMKFGMLTEDYYTSGHNLVNELIHKPTYLEDHPEWFTVPTPAMDAYDGIGQLCLTNEEMIEEMIKNVKQIIIDKDFACKYFMLGMEDNFHRCMGTQYPAGSTCNCVQLAQQTSPTGSEEIRTGVFIIFANKVARAVNQWIEEEHPDKNKVKFLMFAYYHNVEPPVKEVNGKYVVTDERCIPDENLYISYAPLKNDYTFSFGDERNVGINSMVKRWGAITKNLIYRTYGMAFGAPEYPFNDLLNMGGTYQSMFDYNYPGVVDERSTAFSLARLKEYVSSQIWWGNGRNVDQIAFEFIDFYYAPVAKEFKQFYIDLKQFQIHQIENLKFTVGLQTSTYSYSEYWPFDAINYFKKQLTSILDKLGPLKVSDPAEYKKYFDRVNVEMIWVYYILCSQYKNHFNDTDFRNMVDYLEKYVTEYQVQYTDSHLEQFRSWKEN